MAGVIEHLFTYGTLMRDLDYHYYLAENGARFVCKAEILGRLYVCEYPALIAATDAHVHGELYEFEDIARALPIIDECELEGTMYHRVVVRAKCADGRTLDAYAYRYAVSVRSCRLIESGDYRAYLAQGPASHKPQG